MDVAICNTLRRMQEVVAEAGGESQARDLEEKVRAVGELAAKVLPQVLPDDIGVGDDQEDKAEVHLLKEKVIRI